MPQHTPQDDPNSLDARIARLRKETDDRVKRLEALRADAQLRMTRRAFEDAGFGLPPFNLETETKKAAGVFKEEARQQIQQEALESATPAERTQANIQSRLIGTPIALGRDLFGQALEHTSKGLGKALPGEVGEFFTRAGEDLGARIAREHAMEQALRDKLWESNLMGKVEAITSDLFRFGLEMEVAPMVFGRAMKLQEVRHATNILNTARSPLQGLGRLLEREAGSQVLRNVARRSLIDAAQIGTLEAGLGALEGESIDELAARTGVGMVAGAALGGIFQGAGELKAALRMPGLRTAVERQRIALQRLEHRRRIAQEIHGLHQMQRAVQQDTRNQQLRDILARAERPQPSLRFINPRAENEARLTQREIAEGVERRNAAAVEQTEQRARTEANRATDERYQLIRQDRHTAEVRDLQTGEVANLVRLRSPRWTQRPTNELIGARDEIFSSMGLPTEQVPTGRLSAQDLPAIEAELVERGVLSFTERTDFDPHLIEVRRRLSASQLTRRLQELERHHHAITRPGSEAPIEHIAAIRRELNGLLFERAQRGENLAPRSRTPLGAQIQWREATARRNIWRPPLETRLAQEGPIPPDDPRFLASEADLFDSGSVLQMLYREVRQLPLDDFTPVELEAILSEMRVRNATSPPHQQRVHDAISNAARERLRLMGENVQQIMRRIESEPLTGRRPTSLSEAPDAQRLSQEIQAFLHPTLETEAARYGKTPDELAELIARSIYRDPQTELLADAVTPEQVQTVVDAARRGRPLTGARQKGPFTLDIKYDTRVTEFGGATPEDPNLGRQLAFDIRRGDGEVIGSLNTVMMPGKELHISWIGPFGNADPLAHTMGIRLPTALRPRLNLGLRGLRDLERQLQDIMPHERISGMRISGIRKGPAARPLGDMSVDIEVRLPPETKRPRRKLDLGDERGAVLGAPDPLQEIVDPTAPGVTPAVIEALQHLRVGERAPKRKSFHYKMIDLYGRIVRSQSFFERILEDVEYEGGTLARSGGLTAGDFATLTSGSARTVEGALTLGPPKLGLDGELYRTGTPGLEQILAPLAEVRQGLNLFRAYALAARTLELAGQAEIRGVRVETGLSEETARRVVAEASPAVRRAFEEYVQYMRDILQYWADAGGVSPEAVEVMHQLGRSYIPLTRIFEEAELQAGGAGRIGRVGRQLYRLRGSKRTVVDPIESAREYTYRLIHAADRNRAMLNLVETYEMNPELMDGWMIRLSREAGDATDGTISSLAEGTEVRRKAALRQNTFWVWRNGERERWQLAPELARAVRAMWPEDLNLLTRFFGIPARTLKAGVTLTPMFQIYNFVRDTFDAALQSEYGFKLFADSFKGFYSSMRANWLGKASEEYSKFVLGGGGFSSFRGAERRGAGQQLRSILPRARGRAQAERFAPIGLGAATGAALDEESRLEGAVKGAAVGAMFAAGRRSSVYHPFEALREFARPFEEAARYGEYMRARKAGESVKRAVLASRNVTVDFQTAGASMAALNHITAFLNPSIQAFDRFMRVAAREGRGTYYAGRAALAKLRGKSPKEVAELRLKGEARATLATAFMGIVLPSILIWSIEQHNNDEEIANLRKTEQGLIYWFMRMPNGNIIKLPKPFLWGQIFGTGIESTLDLLMKHDPTAMKRWATGMMNQAGVRVLPQFIELPMEQAMNTDFFFRTPIVPPEQITAGISPSLQSKPHTSRVIKAFSQRLSQLTDGKAWPVLASAPRAEALINQLFSSMGRETLELMDHAADRVFGAEEPGLQPVPADELIIGRLFARYPSSQVQPVQDFYKEARRIQQVWADYTFLEREKNVDAAIDFAQANELDLFLAPVYEGAREEMANYRLSNDLLREIPDDVIPAEERRRMADENMQRLIEVARQTNELVALLKEQLEQTRAAGGTAPQ